MNGRPRLLIVLPKTGIPSEIWSFYQAEELAKSFDIHVLTWEREGTQQDRLFDRFPVEMVGSPWQKSSRRTILSRVRRRVADVFTVRKTTSGADRRNIREVVKKIRPSVILSHFEWSARAMVESLQSPHPPVICHVHGRDVGPLLISNRPFRRAVSKTLHGVSHVICVGSSQKARVLKATNIAESKISIIPCGANRENFSFVDRSGRERNEVRFVQVGRASVEKGWLDLVEAFAAAAQHLPDIHLDLVGDGPLMPALVEKIGTCDVQDRMVVHGLKSGAEVAAILANADVMIQNSRDTHDSIEGFGVTLCEGASTGLPLIASRAGGLLDQIEDGLNGILVEQNSPRELKEAIIRLGSSPELRKEMGHHAFTMSKRFDQRLMVEKLSGVLAEAARSQDSADN